MGDEFDKGYSAGYAFRQPEIDGLRAELATWGIVMDEQGNSTVDMKVYHALRESKAVAKLREALRRLLNYLPDGPYYKYVWDECLSDEQEMVKAVRAEAAALLEGNDLGPGISKERMSTGTHTADRNPGPEN